MIRIRPMTTGDLPLGLRLKEQAGWNQTGADWSRFLAIQPDGCFVAELDGEAVATLTTAEFGPVAWIAMMLVDRARRGRGIGRAMMSHALEALDARGVRSIRLDATHLGQPLYERLGFAGEYPLARLAGISEGPEAPPCRPFGPSDLAPILDLDRSATGTDRARLLRRMAEEFPEEVWTSGRGGSVEGYLMARPGSNARQVGPCIARGEVAGSGLLADALGRLRGRPVFVDIPTANLEANRIALAGGLTVQRPFLRMCRGEPVPEDPRAIWASSGPEMG